MRKSRTQEHCLNISKAKKGKPNGLLGKKYSNQHRKNISLSLKGHPTVQSVYSEELNKRRSEKLKGVNTWSKGKILSSDTKLKMSLSKMKEKNWNWKGGKPSCSCGKLLSTYKSEMCDSCRKKFTSINKEKHPRWIDDRAKLKKYDNRRSSAYSDWRTGVFERDNFKCRIADKNCNGVLQAHHILPWRDFVELRYEINNGITLCVAHHPRKRAEEKRLVPYFMGLVPVSK